MRKNLNISSYIREPFLIYDFAPDPIWISLYMKKILFSFYQCTELGGQGASDWICQSADFSFPTKTAGEAKNAREIGIQPLYTYTIYIYALYTYTLLQADS
jgi:hypothetical protein